LVALLKASHFGPTLAVTTVSFLLAASLWWEGPAFVIAFGVFLGQLLVGFTNDLVDYPDDLKHNRLSKPLVSGELTTIKLRRAEVSGFLYQSSKPHLLVYLFLPKYLALFSGFYKRIPSDNFFVYLPTL
jgi:4-hydroxybenzoate polyprenyltransferase